MNENTKTYTGNYATRQDLREVGSRLKRTIIMVSIIQVLVTVGTIIGVLAVVISRIKL